MTARHPAHQAPTPAPTGGADRAANARRPAARTRTWLIPAGTGDWPDFKTPANAAPCDRCSLAATHEFPHAVGEPNRWCDRHYEEHLAWRAGAEARIAAMRDEVAAYLWEHFAPLAEALNVYRPEDDRRAS